MLRPEAAPLTSCGDPQSLGRWLDNAGCYSTQVLMFMQQHRQVRVRFMGHGFRRVCAQAMERCMHRDPLSAARQEQRAKAGPKACSCWTSVEVHVLQAWGPRRGPPTYIHTRETWGITVGGAKAMITEALPRGTSSAESGAEIPARGRGLSQPRAGAEHAGKRTKWPRRGGAHALI